ncbi:MAG TPA: ribosome silencing factor [Candidatus Dorea intestinavium]|nr:ribosome silencing factor [Candidatus Dorea intestinavium]
MNTKDMMKVAYQALDNKQGEDITVIDISTVSSFADYFVITNGNSDTQMRALTEEVDKKMEEAGYVKKQSEGTHKGDWILMDYGDVIVHIFNRDSRSFYNLERIWQDGTIVRAEEL